MGTITLDWITAERAQLIEQIRRIEGALEMLEIIEKQIAAPDAITLDDLKQAVGADTVEVIPLEGGK
jgi:hypothetical protein